MKKLLSLFLCAALLLVSVSAFAGTDASIDFQDRLQLRGTLPDGYKCTILSQSDLTMECAVISDNPAAPRLKIFISFNESYASAQRLGDLDAETLEWIKAGFSEENTVTFDMFETTSGVSLLLVRETGEDQDFLDFYTVCQGHEIELTLVAGDEAPDLALTEEQINNCMELMRSLDILPVQE